MNSEFSVNITNFTLDPVIATAIRITVIELVMKSHVVLLVSFLKDDGTSVKNETVRIDGSDYSAWGTDDDYLINLVMEKFGLTVRTA